MKLSLRRRTTEQTTPAAASPQRRSSFTFGGNPYMLQQTLVQSGELIERPTTYSDLGLAYLCNPVVAACVDLRARLFSEMAPTWRSNIDGKLFGDAALAPLEHHTGALLTRMLLDVDLDGNAYVTRGPDGELYRLRPDCVSILIESPSGDPNDPFARVAGYRYTPYSQSADSATDFLAEEVCHWAPKPDPRFRFRGMSWISSVLADVYGDNSMSEHKLAYFKNGATVNMVVTIDADNPDDFAEGVAIFKGAHEGTPNAHGTLFISPGSSATPVGSDLKSIDFAATQGKAETRIAAAAGVPPSLAGLSEGLASTNYGSNFTASRRACADSLLRPLWRSACAALESLLAVPADARLWYDERLIPFLQEDIIDAANARKTDAATMASLIVAGFTPDSARDSVLTGDASRLVHSGLVPVQLAQPGTTPPADPATNGASADA